MNERVIIPPKPRLEVLQKIHAAHQGVIGMPEGPKASMFWPGITKDTQHMQVNSSCYNRITRK